MRKISLFAASLSLFAAHAVAAPANKPFRSHRQMIAQLGDALFHAGFSCGGPDLATVLVASQQSRQPYDLEPLIACVLKDHRYHGSNNTNLYPEKEILYRVADSSLKATPFCLVLNERKPDTTLPGGDSWWWASLKRRDLATRQCKEDLPVSAADLAAASRHADRRAAKAMRAVIDTSVKAFNAMTKAKSK